VVFSCALFPSTSFIRYISPSGFSTLARLDIAAFLLPPQELWPGSISGRSGRKGPFSLSGFMPQNWLKSSLPGPSFTFSVPAKDTPPVPSETPVCPFSSPPARISFFPSILPFGGVLWAGHALVSENPPFFFLVP